MQLVLLGTTGYHPNDRRQTACLMLPDLGVILDAGTGMYRVRDWLRTKQLDIFLTHAHLDHVVGLTFIFDILWEKADMEPVRVHAEPDKIASIQQHLFAPPLFPVVPPFQWHELATRELSDGGRLRSFPLKHPGGAVGYRIDWPDRSMAYVTDTVADPEADYVHQIRGVDLLVHECYFPDGWEERGELTGHSCTSGVAQVARRAGVKQLVLVHVDPQSVADDPIGIDTARAIFPATTIGEDGMVIDF